MREIAGCWKTISVYDSIPQVRNLWDACVCIVSIELPVAATLGIDNEPHRDQVMF